MCPAKRDRDTTVGPCSMAKQLVPDELWMIVGPLLPPEPPKSNGGRPRVPDRAALAGIIFTLKSGIPWRMLPKGLGFGRGVTCWRRGGFQLLGALLVAPVPLARPGSNLAEEQAESDDLEEVRSALKGALKRRRAESLRSRSVLKAEALKAGAC
jgi:transposase